MAAWLCWWPLVETRHWLKWNTMHLLGKHILSFLYVQQWNPSACYTEKLENLSVASVDPSLVHKLWNHQQGSFFHLYHQWLHRGSRIYSTQLLSSSAHLCLSLQYMGKHTQSQCSVALHKACSLHQDWDHRLAGTLIFFAEFSSRNKSFSQIAPLIGFCGSRQKCI